VSCSSAMGEPVLALERWEMARASARSIADPDALRSADLAWIGVPVPGTVAGAMRDAGTWTVDDAFDFDAHDWWFRTTFDAAPSVRAHLHFGGIATIASVWLNGELVLESSNMFVEHVIESSLLATNEVVVCCRSLNDHLAVRRPRPRWKTRLVEAQQLRWVRTTLLGRMPGWAPPAPPVGMWRAVEIHAADAARVNITSLVAGHDGERGTIDLSATVDRGARPEVARLRVGDAVTLLDVAASDDGWTLSGRLEAPGAAPWFPSTHGDPVLYPMTLSLESADGARDIGLGRVGFRTITVDRADDGFAIAVNGVPVFCRGACWVPPDVVSLNAPLIEMRTTLERMRAAGMNMVRVTGTTIYEHDDFYDLCDELGILVWHDFMFANMEYPVDDAEFLAEVTDEVEQVLGRLRRHPSVAVMCGGSEVEQQAAMMGLDPSAFPNVLAREVLADAVARGLPGAVYVPCSPSGGVFPFSPSTGVAHYYGVGAYRRPLTDARLASVRFASECLAFANVSRRAAVDSLLGDGERAPHAPRWKARVPRDRGAGWDFDDVRDHYVGSFFGCDPVDVRYADPERYLDLGRAAVHIAMDATLSEWRRPGSSCAGALVFFLRDPWNGAGWGILDHDGLPKSAYAALARACAPTAVLLTDDGLNGLAAYVVNDRPTSFAGSLHLRLFAADGSLMDTAKEDVEVAPHGSMACSIDALLGGFRDLTYTYRFGPPAYDVVAVQLADNSGVVSEAYYLPSGHARPLEADVGLRATGRVVGEAVEVHVETDRFAHFVSIDVRDHVPDVDWFHLAPGDDRTIVLRRRAGAPDRAPSGEVRALNLADGRSVKFAKAAS
jgi:beta-mannosidase